MKGVLRKCRTSGIGGRGEGGFSLIEILVVVAILGLISVMMTIAVSKTLKRQRLETAAHEIQSFVTNAYSRTAATGRAVLLQVTAPASDGSRQINMFDDTDNDLKFTSGNDARMAIQLVPGDILVSAPTDVTSWPSPSSDTFLVACDVMGRTVNPTLTNPVPVAGPVSLSMTHKEMGSGGTLRPDIRYDITLNVLWQPAIVKYVNGSKVK